MVQSFKNVYFADFPQTAPGRSSLTLAFGRKDNEVFRTVQHLSSDALRQVLGYQSYSQLQQHAQQQERSVNALCVSILRRRVNCAKSPYARLLPGFDGIAPLPVNPLHATFTGGGDEPLHGWYPYLEAYAPAFVESVITNYCARADTVLDPFSGAGTTPLTVSRLGGVAYYAEVNPVLQFLTNAKIAALTIPAKARVTQIHALSRLADTLNQQLEMVAKDVHLQTTYDRAFGDSAFFEAPVLSDILRCRTLADTIGHTNAVTARFFVTAVLRSLVPSSRLIRRGDVRFKTAQELAKHNVVFRSEVSATLRRLAHDLDRVSPVKNPPVLILENTKNLSFLPPLSLDAVITSPPYLNGTNYFRNTKIELWFLRRLCTREGLSRFRFAAVTAGINDVTNKKRAEALPPSAPRVVRDLRSAAYDSRIPRMVECYASEMHHIMRSLAQHTGNDATIAIDIGDSAYAGVHVPTDTFIAESMDLSGFSLMQEVVLRQRYSRSRQRLTQKLLIFKRARRSRRAVHPHVPRQFEWRDRWLAFKTDLPHRRGIFSKRNWGHPLHSLCSYPGKMKPSLAAHLVRTFTLPGQRVLDPFSGVGTIPFEASLHGVTSYAFDISAPAVHITAAKLGRYDKESCATHVRRLERYIEQNASEPDEVTAAAQIQFNRPLPEYFHAATLNEILLARRYYSVHPPSDAAASLVFSCVLHILHGNRPYALSRRSHPITPFAPTGATEYRPLIPRLRDKLNRSLRASMPSTRVLGECILQDATTWWPADVRELDAVISSPPFFKSTRFHLANWMRLWFAGWEAEDFQHRPAAFVEEKQRRSFDVYAPFFRQCRERMKEGGIVVLHVGASRKCDMATELVRIAEPWFTAVDVYQEDVKHCETHGIRDKGTVTAHKYVVLQ